EQCEARHSDVEGRVAGARARRPELRIASERESVAIPEAFVALVLAEPAQAPLHDGLRRGQVRALEDALDPGIRAERNVAARGSAAGTRSPSQAGRAGKPDPSGALGRRAAVIAVSVRAGSDRSLERRCEGPLLRGEPPLVGGTVRDPRHG